MMCPGRAAASLVACLAAFDLGTGDAAEPSTAETAAPAEFRIEAEPIALVPDRLAGLEAAGAWVLSSSHPSFGGISGLARRGGGTGLRAVTDRGRLVAFGPLPAPGEAGTLAGRLAALPGAADAAAAKLSHDAEALAEAGGRLWVAFEHDHRIGAAVAPAQPTRPPSFGSLAPNAGIEGLATVATPQGEALLAITEDAGEDGARVFLLAPGGDLRAEGTLPRVSRHLVTGADTGPDGRIYLVLRHWSPETGVSIRIRRYALAGTPPMPDPASMEELAAFGPDSGIDNMEGIALTTGPDGAMRHTIVADDNFNPLQRTVIAEFVVTR